MFSGMTTSVLADLLVALALDSSAPCGLWHAAGPAISKADLLVLIRDAFNLDVELQFTDDVAIDRTLDGSRFETATSWTSPNWSAMVAGLAAEPLPYERWRAGP